MFCRFSAPFFFYFFCLFFVFLLCFFVLCRDGFRRGGLSDRRAKRWLRTHKLPWSIWSRLLWYLGGEEETDGAGRFNVFSCVVHQSVFCLHGLVFHHRLANISHPQFGFPFSLSVHGLSRRVSITSFRRVYLFHRFNPLTVSLPYYRYLRTLHTSLPLFVPPSSLPPPFSSSLLSIPIQPPANVRSDSSELQG